MKAGGRLGILVCALAALAAAPSGASRASGKAAELKLSTFDVRASNGYEVEVISARDRSLFPIAVVSVESGSAAASYEVRAAVGPGIHATFGSLGQLDVSFERRRKRIYRPERGCRWIFESGVFRGSFRFVGEGGYVSAEATNPKGEVLRLPNGFCGFRDDRRARPFLGLTETVLAAGSSPAGGTVSFEASRFEFDRGAVFSASLRERVGEMKIERRAFARGGKGTFFSTRASRASVFPPGPFSGSARFRDPAHRPPSWTGALSVALPGAPEVALTGEGFVARLCPNKPILRLCRKSRPSTQTSSPQVTSSYGSGSHSQPLALARLSSLR